MHLFQKIFLIYWCESLQPQIYDENCNVSNRSDCDLVLQGNIYYNRTWLENDNKDACTTGLCPDDIVWSNQSGFVRLEPNKQTNPQLTNGSAFIHNCNTETGWNSDDKGDDTNNIFIYIGCRDVNRLSPVGVVLASSMGNYVYDVGSWFVDVCWKWMLSRRVPILIFS